MVDRCRSLKPTWWLTAVIFVALSSLMSSVEAGAWRDDFEGEDFRGWAIRNPHSVWTVQDGFVHVEVRARGLVGTADFLEFTAFPGPYERFTVTLINPRLSIALGKMFPETGSQRIFFYIFSSRRMSAFQVNRFGGPFVAGFRGWLPRNPATIWREKVVKLTVGFEEGRFRFFADDALRADFEDLHFENIEFITILIMAPDGVKGEADAFEISGPGIGGFAVDPKRKLATTWGRIKS